MLIGMIASVSWTWIVCIFWTIRRVIVLLSIDWIEEQEDQKPNEDHGFCSKPDTIHFADNLQNSSLINYFSKVSKQFYRIHHKNVRSRWKWKIQTVFTWYNQVDFLGRIYDIFELSVTKISSHSIRGRQVIARIIVLFY
jgi:hypothetical protein